MDNFNNFTESEDADELLAYLLAEEDIEWRDEQKILPREQRDTFPASFAQQRLWFLAQLNPESPAYTIPCAVRLQGRLDADRLEECLNEIVRRHEVLRATFITVQGQIVQQIAPVMHIPIPVVETRIWPEEQRESTIQNLIEQEIREPFDLSKGPLLRAKLFCVEEAEHIFLFVIHHIIFDGWSRNVLLGELAVLYDTFSKGNRSPLPELSIQYADFTTWQEQWLSSESAEAQALYWKRQLAHLSPLQLPTDKPRPGVQTLRGATRSFVLPAHVSHTLQAFCQQENYTLFTILLSAFNVLLYRYSGQSDLSVGVPTANRNQVETEALIGLFVNTLVIRTDLSGDLTFRDVLAHIRAVSTEAVANQEIPFEKVVDVLQPERNLSHSPLFQVMFDFQYIPSQAYEIGDLSLRPLEIENGTAKFDLEFNMWEGLGGIYGSVEYNTDIYTSETVRRMIEHYQIILASALTHPQLPVSRLSLLSNDEYEQITIAWNETDALYTHTGCLHQLVEEQVKRSPEAIAVTYQDEQITYHTLNQQANQLARYLSGSGIATEICVGVCMERSLEMVISLLGILKAGGAYVPFDPTYPQERLAFMLEDADISVLLTQKHLLDRLPKREMRVVPIDGLWDEVEKNAGENLQVTMDPGNIAYVIYTSGSTGKPKGVMVTHAGICNRLLWMQDSYHLGARDRVLQKTPFSFDVSVWEFFWPLLTGAQLIMAIPGGHQDPAYLARLITERAITTLHFVPPMLQVFLEEETVVQQTPLKRVICSGEALPFDLQERFFAHLDAELHNLYGPTEASVDVTYWECQRQSSLRTVPIGSPIANTQIYILDTFMQPVPVGVPGELHIGGVGLARGYLKRPELTAEKFIPNPFSQENGMHLYKTGDLARFLDNGMIEYLGRIDQQVKLRGFRIELGEIEIALSMHPDVSETIVLVREDEQGLKRLVAYVVPAKMHEQFPGIMELQEFLQKKLPVYMIPSSIVVLEALPLTANGKIDRRALPVPDAGRSETMGVYVAPATPLEEILSSIWSRVLGIEQIGVNDNFFALGGDSISSIQVLSRAKEHHLHFSLQQLFQYQTIRELARVHTNGGSRPAILPDTQAFSLISSEDASKLPAGVEDAYPLSMLQAGMIFSNEYAPDACLYHNVDSFRLRIGFDFSALETTVQQVIDHHAILRTGFDLTTYTKPLQLVYARVGASLYVEDLRHVAPEQQEKIIAEWIETQKQHLFDLASPPLVRFHIHRLADDVFQFTLPHHHTILDGWSISSLVIELLHRYTALLKNRSVALDLPGSTFRDFIALEQRALQSEESKKYWQEKLATASSTSLPRWSIPLQIASAPHYENMKISFPLSLSNGLKNLARTASVPLKSVLLAVHVKVLSFISGQSTILTGLASDTRLEDAEGDRVLGVYLNSVPFYLQPCPGSWIDLIEQVLQAECELLPFRRYPLAQMQIDVNRNPLFEILFNFTHFHVLDNLQQLRDVEFIQGFSFAHANFTLTVSFDMDLTPDHGIHLLLSYNEAVLSQEQVELIGSYYTKTIEALLDHPYEAHDAQFLLSTQELHNLQNWNRTQTNYPQNCCIHQLFEMQAEKSPDAIAVVFEDAFVSYRELDQRANQLAHSLQQRGVDTEVRVGICMKRSLEMIVGIIGVLKAGGTYVPLDADYPQERLRFMLKDAEVATLLTQQELVEKLPFDDLSMICLDGEDKLAIRSESKERPFSTVRADNLAYIMYTSGSTGTPKGVAIEQRSVARLVKETNYLHFSPEAAFLQFAPISFDASTFEIWGCLLNGARLAIFPPSIPSLEELGSFLQRERITTLWLTAGLFQQMVDEQLAALCHVEHLLTGGDIVSAPHARKFLQSEGIGQLINGYGPTENTTFTCCYATTESCSVGISLPIGCPISNTQVYILDHALHQVPIGTPGELYIGGIGLARGYLHQPGLTAEKFIPNPFSREPGTRLYRTGDLGRFLADGTIEFLGRIDQQVKLRGFRIEPGEIEATLSTHPAVAQVVVLAREDRPGNKNLVAYIVSQGTDTPAATELRTFLENRLPSYMIPSAFMFLENLPLTVNGKVDYQALAKLNAALPAVSNTFVAPRTLLESDLAEIWRDILGIPQVSIDDNFFELGGHSLLATRVIARIRSKLSLELPLRDLFAYPTIAELAESVAGRNASTEQATQQIMPRKPSEPLVLSFAQQRLWFLNQLDPGNPSYNIVTTLRLSGQIDITLLQHSLQALVQRHEVLRTTFAASEGEPVQIIAPDMPVPLSVQEMSALPEGVEQALALVIQERLTPFDLVKGPLLRVILFRLSPEEHVLLLTIHHIIFDGWSIKVFAHELTELYKAFSEGRSASLPELRIQYADFASWQRQWLQGEVLQKQLTYWKQQLDKKAHILDLPVDYLRPAIKTAHGNHQSIHLPASLYKRLLAISQREGTTLFMTLVGAFAVLLFRYTQQTDISIGTPVANRQHLEVEQLIGFFVNTLVLCIDLQGNPSFLTLLNQVREVVLGAYEHQDLPFEKLVEEIAPERDLSRTPLFQVMFSLQHMEEADETADSAIMHLIESQNHTAKFDLDVLVIEKASSLDCVVEYSTDLFAAKTIERLLKNWEILLNAITEKPEQAIGDISLQTLSWEHLPMEMTGDQTQAIPISQNLCQLFEELAESRSDAIALVAEGGEITYGTLNRQANQLASYLQTKGIGPEVLVGLCLERSFPLITAILGVVKAGGAYVPLDTNSPSERLAFILQDCGASLVLSQRTLLDHLPSRLIDVLCIDDLQETLLAFPSTDLPCQIDGQHLAYCIYTSGSTGTPKGVQIAHAQFLNLLMATQPSFAFGPGDTWALFHSPAFDFSVWEIWGALLTGGRLVIVPYWVSRSPQEFWQLLLQERITILNQTPSAFRQLVTYVSTQEIMQANALRLIIFGGETLNSVSLEPWFELWGDRGPTLVNMYGITETTVHVTRHIVQQRDMQHASESLIGQPLSHEEIYLLDSYMQPVPLGVPGEIYVGGMGLARGYLHQPGLTAERFVPHPFSTEKGARLYKSGDLARRLSSGELVYLGRVDHQVKLRGYRIELGEIEAVLNTHPLVRDALVLLHEDRAEEPYLVAYIISRGTESPLPGELHTFLENKLPAYMVPASFLFLEQFPLTSNGKVDRQALPAPQRAGLLNTRDFIEPRTSVERAVSQIWCGILGIDRASIHDNFFEQGGHSLLAVRLIYQLKQRFGKDIPLSTLFRGATIAHIAHIVQRNHETSEWSPLIQIRGNGLQRPFFCIHPIGGNVLCYADLARHLGSDRPFYGLQAAGLDGEQELYRTIEEMAAHYIKAIQTVQARGPYILGGWSMGGVVAFEMAQQLKAQGDEISILALLDSWAALPGAISGEDAATPIAAFMEELKSIPGKYGEEEGALLALQAERLKTLVKTHYHALLSYIPKEYHGHILLFRPQESLSHDIMGFSADWARLVGAEVETNIVQGDHYSMITEPYVQSMAASLKSHIDEREH